MKDNVNPNYYANHKVSPIHLIRDYNLNFNCGNVVKYVSRAKEKNGREDLMKALWYLINEVGVSIDDVPKLIAEVEKHCQDSTEIPQM